MTVIIRFPFEGTFSPDQHMKKLTNLLGHRQSPWQWMTGYLRPLRRSNHNALKGLHKPLACLVILTDSPSDSVKITMPLVLVKEKPSQC